MIAIKAPDGSTINFPDGTPDSVIIDVMRREYPAPGASPAQASPQATGAPMAASSPPMGSGMPAQEAPVAQPGMGSPMAPPMQQGAPMAAPPDVPQSSESLADAQSRVPPGMVFNPETNSFVDTAAMADRRAQGSDNLSASEMAAQTLSGLPFVGRGLDEFMGMLPGPGTQEQRTAEVRAIIDGSARRQPGQALAANIAGGVLGSIPMIGPASAAIGSMGGGSVLTQSLGGLGLGVIGGGLEGASSGALGAVEGERGKGAVQGGIVGAGLGGVVGVAAPVVTAAVKPIITRLLGRSKALARGLGVTPDSADIVADTLAGDARGAARIRTAGPTGTLADTGVNAVNMLDNAIQNSGPAASAGRAAVAARAASANSQVTKALDSAFGAPTGTNAAARAIAERTRAARSAAYGRAYETPIDYAADTGRAIEGVLDRIPPATLNKAIAEANDAMREAGTRNRQIMATVGPDGSIVFTNPPNVQQLDEIKRALGSVAQGEVDQLGRLTAAGIRANRLARDLRDATGAAVPGYKDAVALGGDKIAEDGALAFGRVFLRGNTTREAVSEALNGASAAEKKAMGLGLRAQVDDSMANVRMAMTDQNMSAREAAVALKDFSSRAAREKMMMLLGPKEGLKLYREVAQATRSISIAANVADNSKTFMRRQMSSRMDAALDPGALGKLMQGDIPQSGKSAIQWLTGKTPEALQASKDERYAEIVQLLTGPRARDAEKILADLMKYRTSGQITEAQSIEVVRNLGLGISVSGYQATTQSLSQP